MKYGDIFLKEMKDSEFTKSLRQEKLILQLQEEICKLMESNKVSRIELANRLGRSKGFVTQILNNGRNLTLRTIADVFWALDAEITINVKPEEKRTSVTIIEFPLLYQTREEKNAYQQEEIDGANEIEEIADCS